MLLDTATIAELRETLGDDTYRGFVVRMLAELGETTATLQTLFTRQEFDSLASAAHRTAGSAAGIGAKGLHALLKDIENAARAPSAAQTLPGLLAALAPRATQTRHALDALLGP